MQFITSASLSYFREHGDRFIRSFLSCVDPSIGLKIYGEWSKEGVGPEAYLADPSPRISFVDLYINTRLKQFLDGAKPIVEKKIGYVPPMAKDRRNLKSYNYVFDALTFGKKLLAVCHGLQAEPFQTVIWSDLDVCFHKPLAPSFIEALFKGNDVFYFGRSNQHSETGIVGFQTTADGVRDLARLMEECLVSLSFAKLPGWTDCHIFDHHRVLLEKQKRLTAADLSKGQEGHVIAKSCLAPYLDHMKGPRKWAGSSPEREAYLRKHSQ